MFSQSCEHYAAFVFDSIETCMKLFPTMNKLLKNSSSSSCYYSWLTYNCPDDRDLVLSHLIMLADDDFLKKHCDSETPAPPPNWVSASNQTSGMLAAW